LGGEYKKHLVEAGYSSERIDQIVSRGAGGTNIIVPLGSLSVDGKTYNLGSMKLQNAQMTQDYRDKLAYLATRGDDGTANGYIGDLLTKARTAAESRENLRRIATNVRGIYS